MKKFLDTDKEIVADDLASLLMEHKVKYSLNQRKGTFSFSVTNTSTEKAFWVVREYRSELLPELSPETKDFVTELVNKTAFSLLDR